MRASATATGCGCAYKCLVLSCKRPPTALTNPAVPVSLQEVSEDLQNYSSVIQALHEQAGNLGEQVSELLSLVYRWVSKQKVV